ncbi:BQ2448_2765 [Microbotryum intermedium]|uniref:BQ2448_2765 protein n=1 Tax=Microbotryum intermedium TaxID=269621 RepID=A0A238FDB7_9BASI|nr:BQ2448_2765 [Microbotryum intermedium]
MTRPTTRSKTSSPSVDKDRDRDKDKGGRAAPPPVPVPVPAPIAPRSSSSRPSSPTTRTISPLPSRLVIIACFWGVIVLALPYWWRTTTIERRPLPLAQIQRWVNRAPCYLTPKVSFAFESPATNKDRQVEQAIHATLQRLKKAQVAQCLEVQWAQTGEEATYRILLTDDDDVLKRRFAPNTIPVSTKPGLQDRLFANASTLLGGQPSDGSRPPPSPSMAKFSPTYKLVFSLLNEDSSSGDALLEWDIHHLLKRHIQPLLSALQPLHNFTIDTSIQYFAPLAIPVQTLPGQGSWILEDELRAFVNNADWKLPTSLTLDPILHFILFVPKKEHRPLKIKTQDGRTSPTGFITPQRGGVVIYNPPPPTQPPTTWSKPAAPPPTHKPPNLIPAFRLFESQLRKLLGVPPTLPGPDFVTTWQVDALIRQRLEGVLKDCVESLQGIDRLVKEVKNMRVGRGLQKGVKKALDELRLADFYLSQSPSLSLHHASKALSLASKAYFDPSMLALLYFPDNHKYAIYTPLFGPVAVPLLVALIKEWKGRRKGRERKEEGEGELEEEGKDK